MLLWSVISPFFSYYKNPFDSAHPHKWLFSWILILLSHIWQSLIFNNSMPCNISRNIGRFEELTDLKSGSQAVHCELFNDFVFFSTDLLCPLPS